MSFLVKVRFYLRSLVQKRKLDEQLSEEVRTHMEMATEDNVAKGMSREEARYAALREFGNVASIQQRAREGRGWTALYQFGADLRQSSRRLRRTPAFTVTALATLAICIGANLTIFALVDSILLRSLPFSEADRLVTIFNTYPQTRVLRDGASVANYYERRGQLPAFTGLALYRPGPSIVGEADRARRETIMRVTPEFFSVLGLSPVLGRTFTEEEMNWKTSNADVVILTDTYWRHDLNADPHVIGREIQVNGRAQTVVGVLPPGFRFLSFECRLYFPLGSWPEHRTPAGRHSSHGNQMIARLRPGVSLREAQLQIDSHNAAMEAAAPQVSQTALAGFRSVVVPLHADHVAAVRSALWVMQAGGLSLLLIGAVNLANLLLIRASGRAKELAVRRALGASGVFVLSDIIAETLLLTLTGGLLGLVVGAAGIQLLKTLGAEQLPLGAHVAFDTRLALLTMAGAATLGLAVALPVAWLSLRQPPLDALQSISRGSTSSRGVQTLRHGFVVLQLALALVLLVGAGQLGLSFKKSLEVFPGFRPDSVVSGKVWFSPASAPDLQALLAATEKIASTANRRPEVIATGFITNIPFSGVDGRSSVTIKGRAIAPGELFRGNYAYSVSGDYFAAMGLTLQAGRFLTADDSRRPERVCVIDDDFERRYWPDHNALGARLFEGDQPGTEAEAFMVVGIVGAIKQADLAKDDSPGAVYYPLGHRPDRDVFVVVRASLAPETAGALLQSVIKEVDSRLPLSDIRPMEGRIADSLVGRRSPAVLSGIFAAVALLLAAVGTYGILSYAVTQRLREIGVRMALGAQPAQISRQFLFQGSRLLIVACVLGTAGAWFAGQALQSVLFAVPAFPFLIWAAMGLALASVALLASWLPARRAAKVDPVIALRAE